MICETRAGSSCIRSYQRTIGNTEITVENIEPLIPETEASLEATAGIIQRLYEVLSKYCETPESALPQTGRTKIPLKVLSERKDGTE